MSGKESKRMQNTLALHPALSIPVERDWIPMPMMELVT